MLLRWSFRTYFGERWVSGFFGGFGLSVCGVLVGVTSGFRGCGGLI